MARATIRLPLAGKNRPTSLERTAVHEAGHAVIGRVLLQDCGEATIRQNRAEGKAGHAITADPHRTLQHWQDDLGRWRGTNALASIVRGRIMTYMAGRAAEEEFFGSCGGGDEEDRRQINFMLDELLPADMDMSHFRRYHDRLRAHTQTLVKRHHVAIERVAATLLKRKTLTPKEIERAMA